MIDLYRQCADAIRPKERLDAVAWMEKHFKLTEGPMKGAPFRFRNNPVLMVIFRLYSMQYRELVFIAGTQVGKTIFLLGTTAYEICERPGGRLLVLPDENVAKKFFKNKIKPLLETCPALQAERTGRSHDETYITIKFRRCTMNIAWAGSAASLASDSKQYVDFDETAKMKIRDKEEGDPVSLAGERTKAFGSRGRKKVVTTPTMPNRPGWKHLENSTFHQAYLPCPHCSKRPRGLPRVVVDCEQPAAAERMKKAGYFVPSFARDFVFDDAAELADVERNTTLKCPNCDGAIEEKHKRGMLAELIAVPKYPGRDVAGLHAPSWLSPWITWGAVARKYVEAKRDPDPSAMKNFKNGWEGLPDEPEVRERIEVDVILLHRPDFAPYRRHELPFAPDAIFLTADVRKPQAHFVIRAWKYDMTSALLSYGEVARLRMLNGARGTSLRLLDPEVARSYEWRNEDGSVDEYTLDAVLIDANYEPVEVLPWCRLHNAAYPIKGSGSIEAAFRSKKLQDGLVQFTIKSDNFRTRLSNRLRVPLESPGAWWLPKGAGKDYAAHFGYDHQVEKLVRGEMKQVWKQDNNAMNHYFDCEVYQMAAAAIFRIHDLAPAPPPPSAPGESAPQTSDFVTAGGRIGTGGWTR